MSPPDDDIEFDFFDEEEQATVEASSSPTRALRPRRPMTRRLRRGGPGGPSGTPVPLRPLSRLLVLVGSVTVILFGFAFVISSCTGASTHSQYSSYFEKVASIASQSATDGQDTVAALTTQGLSVSGIVSKLNTIASAEQQNVTAAASISPPGKLRVEHEHLIEALELRVSGVAGLAKAFQKTVGSKSKQTVEAASLSQQAYRLLASDIIWQDLFQAPANTEVAAAGVRQVSAPASHFLANPDLIITEHAMSEILTRIGGTTGTSTPSGLHGTNVVSVAALPNGAGGASQVLSEGTLNTVTTSSSLLFKVTIHDGGISQEVQIPVTLTIGRPQAQGGPITKTKKIQLIDPGDDASVVFGDLGQVPFASQTTVSVDVAKVPGETNVNNNSAQYNVIFSLPA
jgi:hypothetical protein